MRLARTADRTPLVGDREGFVPLDAVAPALDSVAAAVRRAPAGLPDPATATADRRPARTLDLGLPLASPGSLWGIGLNFAAHAADLDEDRPAEPATFLRPPATLSRSGGQVRLPSADRSERVTAEAELAVVVGRTARAIDPGEAADVVAGYLPVLDLTAEDVLERNPRFLTRAKSFEGFLVLGPWITTADTVTDLPEATVRTAVNGEAVASGPVSGMRFSPAEVLARLSHETPLRPGDVVCTGTPGAGRVEHGDSVTGTVAGFGSVTTTVVGSDR